MDSSLTDKRPLPITRLMNFKKQLQLHLEASEMTAAELSRKSGVPKQSISGWLSGSNPRDVRQLKKVAEVLNVTIDELLFGVGIKSPNATNESAVDSLIDNEWISGTFEVKLRRVKK